MSAARNTARNVRQLVADWYLNGDDVPFTEPGKEKIEADVAAFLADESGRDESERISVELATTEVCLFWVRRERAAYAEAKARIERRLAEVWGKLDSYELNADQAGELADKIDAIVDAL